MIDGLSQPNALPLGVAADHQTARESAYEAGHGPEYDQVCLDIARTKQRLKQARTDAQQDACLSTLMDLAAYKRALLTICAQSPSESTLPDASTLSAHLVDHLPADGVSDRPQDDACPARPRSSSTQPTSSSDESPRTPLRKSGRTSSSSATTGR